MQRFLFIGPEHGHSLGGREQLSRLHRSTLQALLGDRLDAIDLPTRRLGGGAAIAALWSGAVDGTGSAAEQRILSHIKERGIGRVWLDGSSLGRLARAIKRDAPAVEVLSFCFNVEARFFLGALRRRPRPRALGVFIANYRAERLAIQYSDRIVALSGRDSDGLKACYGRGATDILPLAIDDSLPAMNEPDGGGDKRPLLFVGGAFYANVAGLRWFAHHVAPHIATPTRVIGRGMAEALAGDTHRRGIELVGQVADLAPFYRKAAAVIAPIFDGSGMKTKVAEAWMHGKPVIGTSEAFTGYALAPGERPCDTAEEMIAAIARLQSAPPPPFDAGLRARYERDHSRAALEQRMSAILER